MRRYGLQVFAVIVLMNAGIASAADLVDLRHLDVDEINQKNKWVSYSIGASAPASQRHAEMLALDSGSSLELLESSGDKVGRHYRYQQSFRGIPIFGKQVVVSEDHNGNIRALFGRAAMDLSVDVQSINPAISSGQALSIAKRTALSHSLERTVQSESIRQMIYIDERDEAHVVYVVSCFVDVPGGGDPAQPMMIVDASTGRILKQWDALRRADAVGLGGNDKMGLYMYGADFGFLEVTQRGFTCIMSNPEVKTVNLNHSTDGSAAFSFICPFNAVKMINGAFSPLNDVHYFSGVVHDLYETYLGSPPLSFKIVARVHYGNSYDGAFWANSMATFGDGASTYHPLVSLDIVAHEVSHGFTEHNSRLTYFGQSGAIDEAYSDIAGEAAEFFLYGANDFMVGAQVVKGSGAVRYMGDPARDGHSIDHVSAYTDGMDVHYASGVYNKAFYVLANTTNWDTIKAFQVFVRANDLYWSSDTNFDDGACAVEKAAVDLGYAEADVTAAFQAVGASCSFGWDPSTAIGLHDGPLPIFSSGNKTIATGVEPPNGEYGIASKATIYRNSGKRYVEFEFSRQRPASVYPYSGHICLSLRDESLPVEGNAGYAGDWAICWYTDAETTPAANGPPWFRSDGILWGDPLNPGPLDAWRITEGDVIGIAVDLDSGKIWYARNGNWVGSPAAGVGAAFDQSKYDAEKHIAGRSVTPHFYAEFQNVTVTIGGNSGGTAYAPPDGFAPWGGE